MTRPHLPFHIDLAVTAPSAAYALVDCGEGRKLERFGPILIDRPEPQAMWQPRRPRAKWGPHAVFSASGDDEEKGRWRIDKPVPDAWPVELAFGPRPVTMLCRLSGLWHLGLFPEQAPHWRWMLERLASVRGKPRLLNLFGYTGAASLIAAAAGAEVVHVDASKKTVAWARENQAASGLGDAPIRWIVEDARKFVAREARRGRTYHGILIDPPKFGRGAEGEVWELFTDLPALVAQCVGLLEPRHSHLILTAYAIRASPLALDGLLREAVHTRGGTVDSGELAIQTEGDGRLLGTSLYARWRSDDAS
jgi:23S rRNA (cytosine1962-C5)-methyltransferase